MVQQLLSLARVLASDKVDFFQNPQGSKRNIFEVADGGADQVKSPVALSVPCARICGIRHPGAVYHRRQRREKANRS
jgi:hypothetical protein